MDGIFKAEELENLRRFNEKLKKSIGQLILIVHKYNYEYTRGREGCELSTIRTDLYLGRVDREIDLTKADWTHYHTSESFPSKTIGFEKWEQIKVEESCVSFPNRTFLGEITKTPMNFEFDGAVWIYIGNDFPFDTDVNICTEEREIKELMNAFLAHEVKEKRRVKL